MTVLVTGGAGYIGSHVVKQLGDAGFPVVVLDDLSKGFRESVLHGELVVGCTGDKELVTDTLRRYGVRMVMHFAAHTVVPESVADPLKYYRNNTLNTARLLECCAALRVDKFVFSSTAAVYGTPADGVAAEDSPTAPINPYGTSKLMTEWMLHDLAATGALRHVTLRYFNVAGADPFGQIGQSTRGATLLTKVVCEVAQRKREALVIYGTDYPTPDGTGVRDYIHVEDLASAHVNAARYLEADGPSTTLNCGYGRGYSVREVIAAVERVHGKPIVVREAGRRAGDPAKLIARAEQIRTVLDWTPQWDSLEAIVRTSLAWEAKLAERDTPLRQAG